MADSNTESTATETESSSGVQKGSEFAHPVGVKDDAIWEKHFGKETKESKGKSTSPREPSESTSKHTASRGEKTPSSSSTSKSTTDSSEKSPKPKADKQESDASSSTSKADSTKDSTEPAGGKTAETDPEAPSKKARDLFAEAKKAEDPREARKLYKRAMKEAFGEVPEEFDDGKYAAIRKNQKAANAALDAKAQHNEGRIKEAAEKLKPAIYVMRQLEGAGIGDKLTVPMVEKAIHVMKALRGLEDGDFTQLAEVVSRAAGVDHDEAMKRFVKGVKVSPEGKAARSAAEQAQREAQEARRELAELRKQLEQGQTRQTEEQAKADRSRKVQEARAQYLDDIQTDLADHPVLKLPRGAERVMAYIIRTADPKLKSARYSFEQAADKIVASERRRVQDARHLLDDDRPTARTETRRIGGTPRAETADAGIHDESPEASFDRIYSKHQPRRAAR